MRKILLFCLCTLFYVAQAQKSAPFNSNKLLYVGGPSITFDTWNTQELPLTNTFGCGSKGVALSMKYHYYFDYNGCPGLVRSIKKEIKYDGTDSRTFVEKISVTPSKECSITMSEHEVKIRYYKIDKSLWPDEHHTESCGHTNLGTRTIEIQEPISFKNTNAIQSVCNTTQAFDLRGYINGTPDHISGQGLKNNWVFDPSDLGEGQYKITISKQYDNGLVEKSITIQVNNTSAVAVDEPQELCLDFGVYSLTGIPANGVWTGKGVTGRNFNTLTAGAGQHKLTYTYSDAFSNCVSTGEVIMTVKKLPEIYAGDDLAICEKATAIDLIAGATLPSNDLNNMTWSGRGVNSNKFTPSELLIGKNTITLTYTDNETHCTAIDQMQITVNEQPEVFAYADISVCKNREAFELEGYPIGGVWSGEGVVNNRFDPSVTTREEVSLTYSYEDNNGCGGTDTKKIAIKQLPAVKVEDVILCKNSGSEILKAGNPTGGTYIGQYIVGELFLTQQAGVGIYNAKYHYTTTEGCSAEKDFKISVLDNPVVDAGATIETCVNAIDFQLNGEVPSGGVYSGEGVFGQYFSPKSAGVGSHIIQYKISGTAGCEGVDTRKVIVYENPLVNAGNPIQVCEEADPISIQGATPTGGEWKGSAAINRNMFDPSIAGAGIFTITYSYTDKNNCTATSLKTIYVNNTPDVAVGPSLNLCVDASNYKMTDGYPKNGTWSGAGLSGENFSPSAAGVGNHTLSYTFTNGFGCSATATKTVSVNKLPIISAGDDLEVCDGDKLVTLTGHSPNGGSWLGGTVNGNNLDLSTLKIGKTVLTYNYTDLNKCSASATRTITLKQSTLVSASSIHRCENESSLDLKDKGFPKGGTWKGAGIFNNVLNPTIFGSGDHVVTYSYTNGDGCTTTSEVNLTILEVTAVEAGVDTAFCNNSSDYDFNYYPTTFPKGGEWSGEEFDDYGRFKNYLQEKGTYQAVYTYSNNAGCVSKDSLNIEVKEGLPKPAVEGITKVCAGDTVELEASVTGEDAQTIFQWALGDDEWRYGKKIKFHEQGDQNIKVEALNESECPVIYNLVQVKVDTVYGSIVVLADTLEFGEAAKMKFIGKGAHRYKWEFGDSLTSIESEPWHYYYSEGDMDVSLTVSSPRGCKRALSLDSAIYIKPQVVETITNSSNNTITGFAKSNLRLYPNPFNSVLSLELINDHFDNTQVLIFNSLGQEVIHRKITSSTNKIDVTDLEKGSYIVHVVGDNVNEVFRIVKQ